MLQYFQCAKLIFVYVSESVVQKYLRMMVNVFASADFFKQIVLHDVSPSTLLSYLFHME